MSRKKVFAILQYLAFLLLGFFLLWLVFRKVDLQDVIYQFKHANYWWLLLSFVFATFSHLARAIRWNILIESMGYKTKTSTTFYAVMIGYLANIAVPRLGEITRCGVLTKKDKIPINSLFGSVVAERVFDMIVLLLLIFMVIIFQLNLVGKFVDEHIFTPVYIRFQDNLGLIILVFAIVLLLIATGVILFRLFLPRLKKHPFYEKLHAFTMGFIGGLKTIQRLRRKAGFFLWTIVIWLMYVLMSYVMFFALQGTAHLTLIDALTVMAIGSLGMVAPVPGGIGAYHFFVTLILFELYLIPKPAAASWATLMHASQGILILALGALSYLMIFLQKRNLNDKTGNHKIKNI